jgi:hypothetical protein
MVLAAFDETSPCFSRVSSTDRAADEKRKNFSGEPASTVSTSLLVRRHHDEST